MRRIVSGGVLGLVLALAMVALGTSAAQADPRDFTLLNAHPFVTITQVYVSASDESDWGDDLLGLDVLLAGESVEIAFDRFTLDTCTYDIKVVYADGDEGYLWAVNLCQTALVRFR